MINMIKVQDFKPIQEGRYLVKTKTKFNERIFDTKVHINSNGYSFDCTNQEVIWVSEKPINL